ncbi:DNA processing protein, partial [Candidatus Hakubella thermalkaliphila]
PWESSFSWRSKASLSRSQL